MRINPASSGVMLAVAAMVSGLGGAPASTAAEPFPPEETIIMQGYESGVVYSVDPVTFEVTRLSRSDGAATESTAIEIEAGSGTILAPGYGTPSDLWTIDALTGTSTLVTDAYTGGGTTAAALDDETLWVAYDADSDADPRESVLATVDRTTGAGTDIAPLSLDGAPVRASAFAAYGGVLLTYLYGRSMQLYSVDTSSGELTERSNGIGDPAVDMREVLGADFDAAGTLWVSEPGRIATVDPKNGRMTSDAFIDLNGDYSETLAIASIPEPAAIEPPVIAPVTTTPALVVGTAFSYALSVTGTAPIEFSVTRGALPAGLTIDATTGVISGTPTVAGSFTFTVTAENAAGSADAILTAVVAPAPAPPPAPVTPGVRLPVVSG